MCNYLFNLLINFNFKTQIKNLRFNDQIFKQIKYGFALDILYGGLMREIPIKNMNGGKIKIHINFNLINVS